MNEDTSRDDGTLREGAASGTPSGSAAPAGGQGGSTGEGQAVARIVPVQIPADAIPGAGNAAGGAAPGTGEPPVRDGVPVGEEKPAAPSGQPVLPLGQARALAAAGHRPTRRRLDTVPLEDLDGEGAEERRPCEAPSNVAGFFGFMKAVFTGAGRQQAPDKSFAEMLREALQKQQGGGRAMQMANPSLFAAMDAPLRGLTPEDVQYAGDVDAALSRRPRLSSRFLTLAIAVFFAAFLVWAAFADIDEVAHSEGSVVGSQRTQSISNLEGGILGALLVREGQTVQKDDVIAQIDNEMAASSYRDAVNRSMDDALAIVRLEAELKDETPVFPKDLLSWAGETIGASSTEAGFLAQAQQIVRDQEVAWRTRQARYEADDAVLRSQAAQREHDVQEQKAHRAQLKASLALAVEQRNAAASLLSHRNFSRLEYLGMEQKVVELKGQVEMLDASIPRAEAAAKEAQHRIESHRAEYEASITEEINKRRVDLATLHETLAAGSDRVTRTDVRSPVRGIVKQIYLNTLGGVVRPGEPIMDIVPLDDTLLVEARVHPQDVAFLHPGQDVMVKVTAYDFSIYGGLEGKLEQISADTIEDKTGEFFYLVKVRTRKTFLTFHNEVLPIIPGMLVQADILIGKKTVLQYIMKPILKAKQRALTER